MSKGSDFNNIGLKIRKSVYIFFKIIFSFNGAALHVLWLKFLQIFFIPIDYIFKVYEHLFSKKVKHAEVPIIFVVGIQRTGSTLVSQFIEKTFPFFPIGNFNSIFKRSGYYLHKWFSNAYTKPNSSYQNFYGISKGFYSIGDCYELWDRWFGKNHYVIPDNLNEKIKDDLILYFSSLHRAYQKPILTKNNRNSLLIPFFKDAFKQSFFIIVKRDPVAVIRSTLKASRDFFGSDNLLWGLYPNAEFNTADYENIVEASVVQFLMLDKILTEQIKQIEKNSYIIVDYDEFCKNPKQFQHDLHEKLKAKPEYKLESIQFRDEAFKTSQRLNHLEIDNQIKDYLYKWKDKI